MTAASVAGNPPGTEACGLSCLLRGSENHRRMCRVVATALNNYLHPPLMSSQPLQQSEQDVPALIDRLTAGIIQGNKEQSDWKEQTDGLKADLMHLHTHGLVPTEFAKHGYKFSVTAGRSTVQLDDYGKEQIEQLKLQLIEEGHGVVKIGNPFWGTRKQEPPKAVTQAAADQSALTWKAPENL